MKPTTVQISKLLSLVLRHKPETIGLQLDAQGWTDTSELLERLNAHGTPVDREGLIEVVATSDKQRFAFNEDGSKIRANQGHSVQVDLGLVAQQPPAVLYHGTAHSSVTEILTHGLKKQNRHHAHLSQEMNTARTVGARHGKPRVLRVNAQAMAQAGLLFYRSDNGVWLTDYVAPDYLQLMD